MNSEAFFLPPLVTLKPSRALVHASSSRAENRVFISTSRYYEIMCFISCTSLMLILLEHPQTLLIRLCGFFFFLSTMGIIIISFWRLSLVSVLCIIENNR